MFRVCRYKLQAPWLLLLRAARACTATAGCCGMVRQHGGRQDDVVQAASVSIFVDRALSWD
jgi:hypothetical protein